MRVARRTSLPIVGPGRARVPEPLMINAPNRPICSVRFAPNTEPVLPSFCPSATPKLCSFISMDRCNSDRRRPRDSDPRSGRLARRQGPEDSRQPVAPAPAAACARAQPPRKHLAVHATELVVEPSFKSFDDIVDHAATPGIPSSISLGKSCPSLAATGPSPVSQFEGWY